MSIRRRSINEQGNYTDYSHLKTNYNLTNIRNSSHLVNEPTNFNLKTITLEDIDMAVFQEFNSRFKIGEKFMPVILLDAEVASIHNQNYIQFDKNKQFLNLPFLTMFRTESKPLRRTSPTTKKVVYVIPKQKPNGIVFEEYITEGPLEYELIYQVKFISNYREYTNQIENQFRYYFRNKRNIIVCNNERFVIGPVDANTLSTLEMSNQEVVEKTNLYITSYNLKVWCFTRDLNNMQKRERPNTFILDITTSDSVNNENETSNISVERFEKDTNKYPNHPI